MRSSSVLGRYFSTLDHITNISVIISIKLFTTQVECNCSRHGIHPRHMVSSEDIIITNVEDVMIARPLPKLGLECETACVQWRGDIR